MQLRASIFLSLALLSGCAAMGDSAVDLKQVAAPAELVSEPGAAVILAADFPKAVAFVMAEQQTKPGDIRRLQAKLREVGYDPGPMDGLFGAKTKDAFGKFHQGCVQAQPILEGINESWLQQGLAAKAPNRQETQLLQTQLRKAGFNPGPVDGVPGGRTRTLLAQLRSGCPMTAEFASLRENPALAHFAQSTARPESAKQINAAAQVARSQEEIRILQLRLRDAGYDPGPFDGVMGRQTRLALQQYEAAQHNTKFTASAPAAIRPRQ